MAKQAWKGQASYRRCGKRTGANSEIDTEFRKKGGLLPERIQPRGVGVDRE